MKKDNAEATNSSSRRLSITRKLSLALLGGLSVLAILAESSMEANAYIAHRGVTYRGPNGGVYHRGATVRGGYGYHGGVYRGGVYRGGYARYGGWARPGAYWWRPGGAIAAGAAIGFVGAATAAAWAGPAPGPGMCWYYTDPSRTKGFWDGCQ